MPPLHINPPLCNSANPWATTYEDLYELYKSPSTGAVTTRTCLLDGFNHDESIHQYAFFDPSTSSPISNSSFQKALPDPSPAPAPAPTPSTLNTLGYSPHPLRTYLSHISRISRDLIHLASTGCCRSNTDCALKPRSRRKPFIISVTGSVADVVECYRMICAHAAEDLMPLAMEVNLSCPNIAGAPPPAYDGGRLREYLEALQEVMGKLGREGGYRRRASRGDGEEVDSEVPIGIKTPPYTHHDQFLTLLDALSATAADGRKCPISFVTATNTLGSCLLLSLAPSDTSSTKDSSISGPTYKPTLPAANGMGLGGLAGAPLHPLALGNVRMLHELISQRPELEGMMIIGVGGVSDAEGFRRMRAVGAGAVEVASALGAKGVTIFDEIKDGLGGVW
ncbi:FMN-linked oxidoreductase [Aulographum hederae CBS 113979]|uniref:Dihydroorotate dehydrogenase (fumarate) n=1 Tax=Aulographum hederae CBS 113979 TaxID=1176131 RepID=A0A6G1H8X3_9PEZI|nr:FMN-linked oxidoreductase [Aulographum hederae CBS 113979]